MFDDSTSNSDNSSNDSETTDTHPLPDEHNHPYTSIERIQSRDWDGFDRRDAERRQTKPYADPEILAYSYWIEGLSQAEIGRRYGVGQQAISHQMDKRGVPTETDPSHFQATLTYAREGAKGGTYDWIWSYCNGERYDAYAHHLVACVENDPHEVFRDGTEVHHETGHPLDNRPEALSVVDCKEHPKPKSKNSGWIIENGEPRLRMNPEQETPNPVNEWWCEVDDEGTPSDESDDADSANYGITVEKPESDSESLSGSGSRESQGSEAIAEGD